MKVSDNALNILTAKAYRGIGRGWIVKNIDGKESTERLVSLLNKGAQVERLITCADFEEVRSKIEGSIAKLSASIDGVVAIGDEDFPPYRGKVKNGDRPVVLFYRGDLRLLSLSNKNIAVIGLLNPDKETEVVECEVVSDLVDRGVTIVSGWAQGCDTIAHRQALQSDGKTIAILPSPLSDILPATNRNLAAEIVERKGLLVTEYYEVSNSRMELSGRYQERDRLQALFSDCVILAASYAKNDLGNDSGSRLAMEYARSYSVPRAVIYDSVKDSGNPKYDLNRKLMSEPSGLVVINRANMKRTVGQIVTSQKRQGGDSAVQADLFG